MVKVCKSLQKKLSPNTPVKIIRNGRSYHSYSPSKKTGYIVLTMSDARAFFEDGARDYVSIVQKTIGDETIYGYQAVYHLMVHEFVHAIMGELGLLKPGRKHGPDFIAYYQSIMAIAPWEDYK